jgi:hypothetical protein
MLFKTNDDIRKCAESKNIHHPYMFQDLDGFDSLLLCAAYGIFYNASETKKQNDWMPSYYACGFCGYTDRKFTYANGREKIWRHLLLKHNVSTPDSRTMVLLRTIHNMDYAKHFQLNDHQDLAEKYRYKKLDLFWLQCEHSDLLRHFVLLESRSQSTNNDVVCCCIHCREIIPIRFERDTTSLLMDDCYKHMLEICQANDVRKESCALSVLPVDIPKMFQKDHIQVRQTPSRIELENPNDSQKRYYLCKQSPCCYCSEPVLVHQTRWAVHERFHASLGVDQPSAVDSELEEKSGDDEQHDSKRQKIIEIEIDQDDEDDEKSIKSIKTSSILLKDDETEAHPTNNININKHIEAYMDIHLKKLVRQVKKKFKAKVNCSVKDLQASNNCQFESLKRKFGEVVCGALAGYDVRVSCLKRENKRMFERIQRLESTVHSLQSSIDLLNPTSSTEIEELEEQEEQEELS